MTALNEIEGAVLDKLLAGEIPTLQILRSQRDHLCVMKREFTGVGFYTEFGHPPGAARLRAPMRVRFGDVLADIRGLEHGAGFVLFIDDGLITMLEGYSTANEPWPELTAPLSLRYLPPERDLGPLMAKP
ncbi:MAG: hypothetical protein NT062_04030 [Proteobacteria bacterium]|nr:hypothetical protein [Pseudomonadota bacterium]